MVFGSQLRHGDPKETFGAEKGLFGPHMSLPGHVGGSPPKNVLRRDGEVGCVQSTGVSQSVRDTAGDQSQGLPFPEKLLKQRIWSSNFLSDLSQVVGRTLQDASVRFYTRTSPQPIVTFDSLALHAQYDWTTGVLDNGNEWRKFCVVPRSHPLRPLVLFLFGREGNRRVSRLPGEGGDHVDCAVEPFCLVIFGVEKTQGHEKNKKLNLLRPKMARLRPLLLAPQIPPEKLMWVPFLRSLPGNEAHKLTSGSPKWGHFGWGQKVYVEKVDVLLLSLKFSGLRGL